MIQTGANQSLDGRFKRYNVGKSGHWYKLDGQKADGVTTIMKSLPKNLTKWAARRVAEEMYDDQELYGQMKKLSRDRFVALCEGIPYDTTRNAANRGTEVHKLSELYQLGEEVGVSDEMAGFMDSIQDFDARYEVTDPLVEFVVAILKQRIMGTCDMICHLPGLKRVINPQTQRPYCECDFDCLTMVDYKTSNSGIYAETAFQLAGYGNADVFIDADGKVQPMPQITHYTVLWIRSDGYDLYPFFINDKVFRTFLYLQQVHHAIDYKTGWGQHIKGAPMEHPPMPVKAA